MVIPKNYIASERSRREFLKWSVRSALLFGGSLFLPSGVLHLLNNEASARSLEILVRRVEKAPEAKYYISTESPEASCTLCHGSDESIYNKPVEHGRGIVKCLLCAQQCVIREGERGKCRTRINVGGNLKSLVYGHPVTIHVDPIEKKPFFHFLPSSDALSLATSGCPLSCKFCQNWQISQAVPEDFSSKFTAPTAVVQASIKRSSPIIAFTYNEPTVFAEYLIDIAREARKQSIRSVLISCGFMNSEPLDDMCRVLDAIKIDLKGFSEDFYKNVCGATLKPVLNSIRQVARRGVHLEIVNLVVPTLNDSKQMLTDLCDWVSGEIGPDVPIHFTRFHPDYKMLNHPPTPISTLEMAYDIAKTKGLRYPYVGNFPGHPGNSTYCPKCGKAIIKRVGFFVIENRLLKGKCIYCHEPIAGVWL
jgi:pyruvate formate lyase activating enzyme